MKPEKAVAGRNEINGNLLIRNMSKIPVVTKTEITDSMDDTDMFPVAEFIKTQHEQMGHEVGHEQICKNKTVSFGIPYESVLGYVKQVDGKVIGASYLWARDLSHDDNDLILVETTDGLQLTPINQAIASAFHHQSRNMYEIEFGGSYVRPEHRGKGIFSELFSSRTKTINEIQGGSFELVNNGVRVDPKNVFITLTAKGSYSNKTVISNLKQKAVHNLISFADFMTAGIPMEMIGVARPESAASTHKAQTAKMQLIGLSSNNLGPVYALPLSVFGKQ